MSTMLSGHAPFKTLLGYALARDQWGRPMHKSEGNSIAFEGVADTGYEIKNPSGVVEKQPPMGADLVRWLFARHNPANNISFGAASAEEIRSKFILKVWNTYAFFCNYARLDGFDPAGPQVPLAARTDLDRWILSDLQLLIGTARSGFEAFDIASFCLECEKFVDERLSNWYVRRNRRRYWKSESGDDKWAAYQTLYTVLVTLSKLMAPVIPFLSEAMYQNLVRGRVGRACRVERPSLCLPRARRGLDRRRAVRGDGGALADRVARIVGPQRLEAESAPAAGDDEGAAGQRRRAPRPRAVRRSDSR